MKRIMSDGVLAFPCPKCGQALEVGLHVVETAANPTRKSPITGTTYGHRVELIAEAPHLHAEFWGHLVRCHQPNPHPYMEVAEPSRDETNNGVVSQTVADAVNIAPRPTGKAGIDTL